MIPLFIKSTSSVIKLSNGSFKSPAEAAEFYLEKLEKGGAKKTRQFQVDLVSYNPRMSRFPAPSVVPFRCSPHGCFSGSEFENRSCPIAFRISSIVVRVR